MENHDADVSVVRQQGFECQGPIDVAVELDGGRLDITLVEDPAASEVTVQVRPGPTGHPPWNIGINGLLSWLGERTGAVSLSELAAEAVRRTTIDFAGGRLTVCAPREFPLRTVPLIIQVSAPSGSSITARSGSADVAVTGEAARLEITTGSGQVRARRCTG
ncbi:MAG TPA: hypothetical protein VFN75_02330, partial [Pseudonocardiaceae bacterium]|nr:hypothetical protein [Pseudonocardiaceae bacterium]